MTIQYYIGGKLVGLAADTKPLGVPEFSTFIESDTFKEFILVAGVWEQISGAPPPLPIGGFVELGRNTLGGASANIDVTSLANKRYLMILGDFGKTSGLVTRARYNSDVTSLYADRRNTNSGADSTNVNQAFIDKSGSDSTPMFSVGYVANLDTREKMDYYHSVVQEGAGAASPPTRIENNGKYAETTIPISAVNFLTSASTFTAGSEVVVLGWDPADVHTDNFWEELNSSDANGNWDSGTITAKKYLWLQMMFEAGGDHHIRFNADAGNSYARRDAFNGGTTGTGVSQTTIALQRGQTIAAGDFVFYNLFILNNTSSEKLVYWHANINQTPGASGPPTRVEGAAKWINTSVPITNIAQVLGSGLASHSVRVWGGN